MKKQTVLQWLYSKLDQMPTRDEVCDLVYKLEAEAKAMEKEQIVEAYIDGEDDETNRRVLKRAAEQYYNETYGGDE